MADSTIPLNPGSGGKTLDTESLTGAGSATVERQRVELAGAALAEVSRVMNSAPAGTEYALVTRPIAPTNTPVTGTVSVSNLPATQPVSGTVSVGNFPATQPVSGTVAVSNLPSTQAVSGTVTANQGSAGVTAWKVDGSAVTQPVSGSVSVSNFPASQAVTGTFWQATQPVSGTVTATVSGATLASMAAATSSPTGVVSLGNSLGKALVMKTGTLASSATTADQVVLTYTVTTGKTFYLEYVEFNARLTTYAATATLFGAISLETPSGTKVITTELFHSGTYPACIYTMSEPIPVAAGVVIRIVCTPAASTAMTWRASFGGYEK